MLRRNPGKYSDFFNQSQKSLLSCLINLRSRHALLFLLRNAQLLSNSKGRIHMIPGNHYRVHMGPLKALHSRLCLLSGRVNHPHQTHENHIFFVL